MSEEYDTIVITPEEAGMRLDKILALRYTGQQSRTYFQSLIDAEHVLVNGIPVKKRIKLEAGDEVEIRFILTNSIELSPENIPLDILYEDEYIVVINKSAGLVVHPAPGNWSGTVVNAILHHCNIENHLVENDGASKNHLRPGIVHRLDKDTSGVLVIAKTLVTHRKLVEMFAARQVYKEYIAICIGNPGKVLINKPIGRHPVHRKMMAVVPSGKEAITHCCTLAIQNNLALVLLNLETGRTHQIRVHMKECGTPILGDELYGNGGINSKFHALRQMLHAFKIQFFHPIMGNFLEIKAPLPSDMLAATKIFNLRTSIFLGQL